MPQPQGRSHPTHAWPGEETKSKLRKAFNFKLPSGMALVSSVNPAIVVESEMLVCGSMIKM